MLCSAKELVTVESEPDDGFTGNPPPKDPRKVKRRRVAPRPEQDTKPDDAAPDQDTEGKAVKPTKKGKAKAPLLAGQLAAQLAERQGAQLAAQLGRQLARPPGTALVGSQQWLPHRLPRPAAAD